MEKTLLTTAEEFEQFKVDAPKGYDRPWHIGNVLKSGLGNPTHYPCLLAWSIENDSDDGLFLVSEFIYLEDFNVQ